MQDARVMPIEISANQYRRETGGALDRRESHPARHRYVLPPVGRCQRSFFDSIAPTNFSGYPLHQSTIIAFLFLAPRAPCRLALFAMFAVFAHYSALSDFLAD